MRPGSNPGMATKGHGPMSTGNRGKDSFDRLSAGSFGFRPIHARSDLYSSAPNTGGNWTEQHPLFTEASASESSCDHGEC